MPELPEVEAARRLAEKRLLGRRIRRVSAVRDPLFFRGTTPSRVRCALRNSRITGTGRRGKFLWLKLHDGRVCLFHFGMTGDFHFYDAPADRPRFWRMEWALDDGLYFAVSDIRRFGRFELVDDLSSHPSLRRLGPDPLVEGLTVSHWLKSLGRRSAPIKSALLDQRVVAGVGNWIADEALFHARISPHRQCHTLVRDELLRLRQSVCRIIREAIRVNADSDRFPKAWLFHRRWGRVAGSRTAAGHAIHFDTIGGRTSAWVPDLQK